MHHGMLHQWQLCLQHVHSLLSRPHPTCQSTTAAAAGAPAKSGCTASTSAGTTELAASSFVVRSTLWLMSTFVGSSPSASCSCSCVPALLLLLSLAGCGSLLPKPLACLLKEVAGIFSTFALVACLIDYTKQLLQQPYPGDTLNHCISRHPDERYGSLQSITTKTQHTWCLGANRNSTL
jgi:hypothetical protein